ncbi:hypothetical protein, partial [Glutamicibacter arilaitensis]|uniref:hypothetical protein n=1 Tax=Glutamicibacter arilaitensis TaxID=256701 RepID=UPI003FCF6D55
AILVALKESNIHCGEESTKIGQASNQAIAVGRVTAGSFTQEQIPEMTPFRHPTVHESLRVGGTSITLPT